MLGKIFSILVISAFLIGGFNGKMECVSSAAIDGATDAVKLSFSMLGIMCLWSGIIRVLDKAGVTRAITFLISPIIKIIFPKAYKTKNAINDIAADYSANFLGLGNAALPISIKAMTNLKKDSLSYPGVASDEMIMFSVLNTAPFQLIPTTLIALRNAHNSQNSFEIILPIWICSALTTIFGVILCKLLSKIRKLRGKK